MEAKSVTKTFPSVRALNAVNFNLKFEEIHALVGENGAGKSTLINVLMGLYHPDAGSLYISEKEVVFSSPHDAIKHGITVVPQELNLIPELSVAENIFMGAEKRCKYIRTINWKSIYRNAELLLASMGAKLDIHTKVGNLSVANQQFVQIARCLALNTKIMIFDEPTACLTIKEADRLLALIRRFKQEGKSIIYISHHLEEVIALADRTTVMRDGCVVEVLDRKQFEMQRIIKGMVGREVLSRKIYRGVHDTKSVLNVRGLTRHNEFEDISFDVQRGEIFGIAGLVGAGRTELLTTIFGSRRPHSGEIFVKGEKIARMTPAKAIALGLGYVHEERRKYGIFPILSVRENITLTIIRRFFRHLHILRREQCAVAEEYKIRMNIKTASIETPIGTLSGGNQQKAILARWLATGVDILMLDEPTRGIDVSSKAEIHAMLRDLADRGYTILLVSSDLEEVINLCDNILVMHEGKMKGLLNDPNITQEQLLEVAIH